MKQHPVIGESICRPLKSFQNVLPIIRHHHEHWDGSGYPDRLTGYDIPLLARVLQVVDVYDALRTARPYKPALNHEEAKRTMIEEAGPRILGPQSGTRVLFHAQEEGTSSMSLAIEFPLSNERLQTAQPQYSIVVPAYNERERIGGSLEQMLKHIRAQKWSAEVVVVNDGSRDDTAGFVSQFAADHPEVRLIENPGNQGKGYAVRNGVLNARGKVILFTDADLSSPITEATKAV